MEGGQRFRSLSLFVAKRPEMEALRPEVRPDDTKNFFFYFLIPSFLERETPFSPEKKGRVAIASLSAFQLISIDAPHFT